MVGQKIMSKTQDNLQAAFAGEAQANRRYLAFAKKAEGESQPNLAKLFRAAAEGETIHALNHFSALGGVKTSLENVREAIAGGTYEIEKMYPEFLADAAAENESRAKLTMGGAVKVEAYHQKFFQEALEKLESGADIKEGDWYVCQVCGYPEFGRAPEICPVCGAPKEKFKKTE